MDNLKPEITVFAKTNFRNREAPFGIKTDDRRRHMYVIGKTGMGKTTLMENMVIQDIRNGHGVAFLDPHGDSVQRILDSIPSGRVNDVIYFNPADMEFPIAFNILEAVDPKYKHLVASGLMGVFTKIWANLWSARMEYILNNTILALLDSPGNTLLGITRMYVDKKYRKKIVDNIKDPMVRSFWTDEFANYNEKYRTEAIAPIQNKVGQFLSSGIIRNIVGQPKSTIDLREIMDERKILIMDLSKGKVGEDNSALLGAMIVTKLQLAAMSRTDMPEQERKDFYLYVDEFQNFATESFATILSEARKYRLNLIIGHQYIAQLEQERSTKVRDAIFGNVGTIVVFRIGAADAEFLETEFDPIFTPNDLVNLPKHHIILKLMINGVASDPFTAVTLPPNPVWNTGNAEKVIKVSRERYSNKVLEVEDKISRWMGAEFHQESALMIGAEEQPSVRAEQLEQNIQSANEIIINTPQVVTESVQLPEVAVSEVKKPVRPPQNQKNAQDHMEAGNLSDASGRANQDQNRKEYANRVSQRPEKHYQEKKSHSPGSHNPERLRHKSHKQQPAKKENPIWQTVASLNREKTLQDRDYISEPLGGISKPQKDNDRNLQSQAESPALNNQENKVKQEPQVPVPANPKDTKQPSGPKTLLQPGKVHKF